MYDARGNGNGAIAPTITGDHQNRITDYTAIALDRASYSQGANAKYGIGIDESGIAFSLTAMGPGTVSFTMQSMGDYKADSPASSLKQRDYKDATDLIVDKSVRRLTPLECERLQGFPDYWTAIPSKRASDSARFKALGNSIALPPWRPIFRELYSRGARTMASLFDGIGGFPLIWQEIGDQTLWASEIEAFPIEVTEYHFNSKGGDSK